jgi:hypothetical protein
MCIFFTILKPETSNSSSIVLYGIEDGAGICDLCNCDNSFSFIFVFMGLIPRLLRRELNLVLPSFSQKHPKYPVACCGDFLFENTP